MPYHGNNTSHTNNSVVNVDGVGAECTLSRLSFSNRLSYAERVRALRHLRSLSAVEEEEARPRTAPAKARGSGPRLKALKNSLLPSTLHPIPKLPASFQAPFPQGNTGGQFQFRGYRQYLNPIHIRNSTQSPDKMSKQRHTVSPVMLPNKQYTHNNVIETRKVGGVLSPRHYCCRDIYEFGEPIPSLLDGESESKIKLINARHRETGKEVTIKIVPLTPDGNSREEQLVKNEINSLRELKHLSNRTLIELVDVYREPPELMVVLERVDGGMLLDEIIDMGYVSEGLVADIVRQLASTLHVMHARHVFHRDIRLSNIKAIRRPLGGGKRDKDDPEYDLNGGYGFVDVSQPNKMLWVKLDGFGGAVVTGLEGTLGQRDLTKAGGKTGISFEGEGGGDSKDSLRADGSEEGEEEWGEEEGSEGEEEEEEEEEGSEGTEEGGG